MRKTLLRISLSGFVAAALLLTSCEQPTSFDVSYGNIGSVQNLKVQAYTGVNLLTWDPIADAQNYEVYRREKPAGKDWSEYKMLNTGITGIRYLDIISDSNVLKDDSEYTYKVIAKSRDALNLSSSSSEASYKTDAAKFPTATPQFPAKGTALTVPITSPAITVDNTLGIATLTWTSTNDNPAITYRLSGNWSRSGAATVATQTVTGDGFVNAQIIATFNNSNYYPVSAPVYVDPVAHNVQHLDSIQASIQNTTRIGKTNQVIVTYTKVKEATAYVLQKAKTNNVGAVLTWTDVATTGALDKGTTFDLTDTIDADAWRYRLFVRTANGISTASPPSNVNAVTLTAPSLGSPSRVLFAADSDPTDGLDTRRYRLSLTLSYPEEGVAYQLYVRKYGDANGSGSDTGEWVASGDPLTAVAEDVPLTFYYNPANAQRQQYEFAVRGTKDGYSNSFTSSPSGPTAAKNALNPSVYISGTDVVLGGISELQSNESIKVYARKINTTTSGVTTTGAYALVHTFTAPASGSALTTTKDIGDPGTNNAWDTSNVRREVVIGD